MEYHKLKIKVISAVQFLKNANLFSKMDDICCQVSIVPGNPSQKTDAKPNSWMEFVEHETYLAKPGLVLVFQIKNQLTNKEIGHVEVPVEQLHHGKQSSVQERVFEYQTTSKPEKEIGFLKFAYILDNEKQVEKRKDKPVTTTYNRTCRNQEPQRWRKLKKNMKVAVALFILGYILGMVAGTLDFFSIIPLGSV